MNWYKLGYGIFIGFVVTVAVLMAATMFPIPRNYQIRIVKSGSMEPAIHTGSIVVIKPQAGYGIGDIVTFGDAAKGAMPTTHRITDVRVESGSYFFKTKGDANDTADSGEVPQSAIVGKALFSVPYAGFVIDAARKPIGFFFLIILPALIIAVEEISGIWKEIRKMRNKKSEIVGDIEPQQ